VQDKGAAINTQGRAIDRSAGAFHGAFTSRSTTLDRVDVSPWSPGRDGVTPWAARPRQDDRARAAREPNQSEAMAR